MRRVAAASFNRPAALPPPTGVERARFSGPSALDPTVRIRAFRTSEVIIHGYGFGVFMLTFEQVFVIIMETRRRDVANVEKRL
jgi:hypothetical protein